MKLIKILLLSFLLSPVGVFAQNWQLITTGYNFIMMDISFPDGQSQVGYMVGENVTYNGNGIILKTTDAGLTWTQLNTSVIPGLEACWFTDVNTGYIGGWQNYFAKTTDGGLTWTSSVIDPNIYYISEIDFYDELNGIVGAPGGLAFVTSDAGASWTQAMGYNVNTEDICYASSSVLYAVGGDQNISKSTDGGFNWTQIYPGIPMSYFLGVDFYDEDYGIVGGEDDYVMVTNDGGASWVSTYSGPGYHLLHGVHVFNTDSAYVAGTPEGVMKTTDGGINWTSEYPGAGNFACYKIVFAANSIGFVTCSQGKLLRKEFAFQAGFSVDQEEACEGSSLAFTSSSPGASSWEWSFPGGIPASSTLANPSGILYTTAGDYDVQLITSNGISTDTLLMTSYIHIGAPNTPAIAGSTLAGNYNSYIYSTAYNTGSQYSWSVNGGTITAGTGTYQVSILWGAAGQGFVKVTEQNAANCLASDSIPVTITVNIGIEPLTAKSLKIYPDPAQASFHVDSPTPLSLIVISDMAGRKLQEVDLMGNNSADIDISHLLPGMYMLSIQDINGNHHAKSIRKLPN